MYYFYMCSLCESPPGRKGARRPGLTPLSCELCALHLRMVARAGHWWCPPGGAAECSCPDLCPLRHKLNATTLGSLTGCEVVLGRVREDLSEGLIAGASGQSPGLGAL